MPSRSRIALVAATLLLACGFWIWLLAAYFAASPESSVAVSGLTSSRATPVENAEAANSASPATRLNSIKILDQLDLAKQHEAEAREASRQADAELAAAAEQFRLAQARQASIEAAQAIAADDSTKLVANAARQPVEVKLTELAALRLTLLERLTVEHPEVQELDARIAETSRQLAMLADFIPRPAAIIAGGQAERQSILAEAVEQYQAASARLASARQSAQQTNAKEQTAALRLSELAQCSAEQTELDATKSALAASTRPAGRWDLFALSGLAIITSCSAVAVGGGALRQRLTTVEQLEAALGVPVLSTLATFAPDTSRIASFARNALRISVLAAIASLAFGGFVLLTSVAKDADFASELVRHPLSGLATALRQLW